MKTFYAIVCLASAMSAAQAVTVDLPGRSPLAEFVAQDLTRLLGAEAEKITLRTDAMLPAQGWRLKSAVDGSLVILGRDVLGIASGAYNFLEKYAGVNWFAPDTECVPDLANWKLPTGLDETRQPAFSQREMFVSTDFMDDLVAADNVNVRYCCSWVFDPLLPGTPQGDKLVRWTKHAKHFGVWTYGRTYRGVLFPFVRKALKGR